MRAVPDAEYHQQRARAEMDLAESASCRTAAEAHKKLAGLHIQELKREDEMCGGSSIGRGRDR